MMRSTCQRCGGKGSIINTPCAEVQAKKKKTMTSKPKKVGLSVGELIVKAVAASKERNGLSVAALKKALAAGGYDVDKNKARVKTAIKSLVAKGTLVQTKGTRTSGSFKMNKATESKAKKPAAAKAKKPAAAAKKSPKKAAAALQLLDRTTLKENCRDC
ncbi:histone H1-like [Astatotilapia calliptera]|uniref:histone H1-like n=1 Tax=Astatotilapia calliptera TaxID=8154 RepID=UPI000E42B714|nr:histone H1-like [Astatotilapia calliptera]